RMLVASAFGAAHTLVTQITYDGNAANWVVNTFTEVASYDFPDGEYACWKLVKTALGFKNWFGKTDTEALLVLAPKLQPGITEAAIALVRQTPTAPPPALPIIDPTIIPAIGNFPEKLPGAVWLSVDTGTVTIEQGRSSASAVYSITPLDTLNVEAFAIARLLVTNADFQRFENAADGYRYPLWWDFSPGAKLWRERNPEAKPTAFAGEKLPRTNLSWYEAVAYTRWLTHHLNEGGREVRLPTEAEWQLAAGGGKGLIYPYGNGFDRAKCNTAESGRKQPTAVETYKTMGESPCGALDMAGNVWEWCLNTPSDPAGMILSGTLVRAARGGSYYDSADSARTGYRARYDPGTRAQTIGMRLIVAAKE
ncbi:MAG TPA: SUMF1/EgtB/PvdO family nonheme iron enzyme, partial [Aggregatilineales bacterium]|nr:SUMF1/EgtB/PvdO family nonheme iron enzyme [Aggregatilineales bacterium]